MNRRQFIKNSSAAAAFTLLPAGNLMARESEVKLTILHTNDQHSRIEPFEPSNNDRYSNKGGFARRASLIDDIRKKEPNVLLLDSGDIFQGTPYFNMYGGELEFKLMSLMKYDVSTLGNHDFDLGMKGILKQLPNASFQFVNANYDFKNTLLENYFKPYTILKKGGLKIGIFGVGIDLTDLVLKDNYGELKYLDPIEIAQQCVKELKDEKCDFIICLSHIGFEYKDEKVSDRVLAQNTDGIDLILGGHTHTFLPEPVEEINRAGEPVIINQVGWAGLFLGRLDFYFHKGKKKKVATYSLLPIDNHLKQA